MYRVLVVDPVGLTLQRPPADSAVTATTTATATKDGRDTAAVAAHVQAQGAHFHYGEIPADAQPGIHFAYHPDLHEADAICALAQTHDAVIAAATPIPANATFDLGGVRIGAGTGNMASNSWGGSTGRGGIAPLMNTPGFNTVATAQMVFKALLRVQPDLPLERLHRRVCDASFDTATDLTDFATQKLAGRRIAVLGFGNIGRAVARLAAGFQMQVSVYARPHWQPWIEAEGMRFAASPIMAAQDADVLSVHLGLGPPQPAGAAQAYANSGLVGATVLERLAPGATLINFDRGELVDVAALSAALAARKLGFAAIDADLFGPAPDAQGLATTTAGLRGPMVPYLDLVERFRDRLLLLPHAAADTDHPSRVAGAIQAIDQILGVIRAREVRNRVGDLPVGYTDLGAVYVPGVTALAKQDIDQLVAVPEQIQALREQLAQLDQQLGCLAAGETLTDQQGRACVLAAVRLRTQLEQLGFRGPYQITDAADPV